MTGKVIFNLLVSAIASYVLNLNCIGPIVFAYTKKNLIKFIKLKNKLKLLNDFSKPIKGYVSCVYKRD